MEKRATNRELIASKASTWAMLGSVFWVLAIIFAILGIVADAMNATLGLEQTSWFLLAIVAMVTSGIWYLSWAVALYLRATVAKKKE